MDKHKLAYEVGRLILRTKLSNTGYVRVHYGHSWFFLPMDYLYKFELESYIKLYGGHDNINLAELPTTKLIELKLNHV